MINDAETDAGQCFLGQTIAFASQGNWGQCQIWNPPDSGVYVYLDRFNHTVIMGGYASDIPASDFRKVQMPFANEMLDPVTGGKHVSSTIIGSGIMPKAQMRIQTVTAGNNPTRPPFQELWVGVNSTDKFYKFDPPLRIDPGWGLYVAAAFSGNNIVSWRWREKSGAPLPPVQDAIVTNLNNGANAFDGNPATYANALNLPTAMIGRTWAIAQTHAGMAISSPTGRSYSGGATSLTWVVESFNGAAWVTVASGSFTETNSTTQSVVSATFTPVTSNGIRSTISGFSGANVQIAEVSIS